ncbi:hypothetical protein IMSAG013_00956 [Clostridiales bacterium]|nr:hypothetical protein IMSAG013_00956 [Clostridiales bacterium]
MGKLGNRFCMQYCFANFTGIGYFACFCTCSFFRYYTCAFCMRNHVNILCAEFLTTSYTAVGHNTSLCASSFFGCYTFAFLMSQCVRMLRIDFFFNNFLTYRTCNNNLSRVLTIRSNLLLCAITGMRATYFNNAAVYFHINDFFSFVYISSFNRSTSKGVLCKRRCAFGNFKYQIECRTVFRQVGGSGAFYIYGNYTVFVTYAKLVSSKHSAFQSNKLQFAGIVSKFSTNSYKTRIVQNIYRNLNLFAGKSFCLLRRQAGNLCNRLGSNYSIAILTQCRENAFLVHCRLLCYLGICIVDMFAGSHGYRTVDGKEIHLLLIQIDNLLNAQIYRSYAFYKSIKLQCIKNAFRLRNVLHRFLFNKDCNYTIFFTVGISNAEHSVFYTFECERALIILELCTDRPETFCVSANADRNGNLLETRSADFSSFYLHRVRNFNSNSTGIDYRCNALFIKVYNLCAYGSNCIIPCILVCICNSKSNICKCACSSKICFCACFKVQCNISVCIYTRKEVVRIRKHITCCDLFYREYLMVIFQTHSGNKNTLIAIQLHGNSHFSAGLACSIFSRNSCNRFTKNTYRTIYKISRSESFCIHSIEQKRLRCNINCINIFCACIGRNVKLQGSKQAIIECRVCQISSVIHRIHNQGNKLIIACLAGCNLNAASFKSFLRSNYFADIRRGKCTFIRVQPAIFCKRIGNSKSSKCQSLGIVNKHLRGSNVFWIVFSSVAGPIQTNTCLFCTFIYGNIVHINGEVIVIIAPGRIAGSSNKKSRRQARQKQSYHHKNRQ